MPTDDEMDYEKIMEKNGYPYGDVDEPEARVDDLRIIKMFDDVYSMATKRIFNELEKYTTTNGDIILTKEEFRLIKKSYMID